jgi:hypothetical protein
MAETLSRDEQFPVIARFEIRRRAYLAPDGTGLRRLPSFAYDIALLVSFYRAMVLARAFDLKARWRCVAFYRCRLLSIIVW